MITRLEYREVGFGIVLLRKIHQVNRFGFLVLDQGILDLLELTILVVNAVQGGRGVLSAVG